MPTSFLDLPGEIRNEIYKYLLVHDVTIKPWSGDHALSPNILATNRTILREASSILYGNNCFDFTRWGRSPYWIQVFFGAIGIINMGYFRSICLDFPQFDMKNESPTLDDISQSNLEIIEGFCTRLETVTITPFSISVLMSWLEHQKNYPCTPCGAHDISGPVLFQVDFALRANPTVKHINVEGHWTLGEKFADQIQRLDGSNKIEWKKRREEMERLGWRTRDVKFPSDEEETWCPREDDHPCFGLEIEEE